MKTWISNFVRGEEGATMVEYGIMVAGIAGVCLVAVYALGGRISAFFDTLLP
jgi:pilus assembly protein Flp/PilA